VSLAIKYEDVNHAKMRLRNTVVLYKGDPVLIQDVQNGPNKDDILRVLFQELPLNGKKAGKNPFKDDPFEAGAAKLMEDQMRKYISSKHFDIAPFKLGYVNRPGHGAFYCTRLPNRVQKQGLCAENFSAKDNYGAVVNFPAFLACKETVDMVKGNYPSFDQAVRALDKELSVAFTRDFCLMKDDVIADLIFLYHKGSKVGMYTRNGKEVMLGKKFNCLRESLQEQQLKVGVC